MVTQTILFIGEAWQLKMPVYNLGKCNIICKETYDAIATIKPDFLIDATRQWYQNIHTIETMQMPACLHAPDFLLENLPKNSIRFIAWNGFLQKDIWEYAGNISNEYLKILEDLFQKKLIAVPDEIGLVSGQIVCGIINEAFLTYEEGISKKEDIDIAMKLGTNYPYGPFEWCEIIGINEVKAVLAKKAIQNKAYVPAHNLLIV
jgi:3-hydroxybutyryl-CoA dehydrogenase